MINSELENILCNLFPVAVLTVDTFRLEQYSNSSSDCEFWSKRMRGGNMKSGGTVVLVNIFFLPYLYRNMGRRGTLDPFLVGGILTLISNFHS